MGVMIWIMCGVAAGSVAKRLMPGPNAGGIVVAIIVGVAGALIGGLLGTFASGEAAAGFDVRSLLMAINGTLIALFSYRCLAMRSNSGERLEYHS